MQSKLLEFAIEVITLGEVSVRFVEALRFRYFQCLFLHVTLLLPLNLELLLDLHAIGKVFSYLCLARWAGKKGKRDS